MEVALKNSFSLGSVVALTLLAGCSSNHTYVKKGEIQQTIVQEPEKKRFIETIGIGGTDAGIL